MSEACNVRTPHNFFIYSLGHSLLIWMKSTVVYLQKKKKKKKKRCDCYIVYSIIVRYHHKCRISKYIEIDRIWDYHHAYAGCLFWCAISMIVLSIDLTQTYKLLFCCVNYCYLSI
jgi:hypothetical protein